MYLEPVDLQTETVLTGSLPVEHIIKQLQKAESGTKIVIVASTNGLYGLAILTPEVEAKLYGPNSRDTN